MRHVARVAALLTFVAIACGQVEPVLLAVSMPDCSYQGPVEMQEGEARLILTLNGLGNARVVLVELTGDHTYGDAEDHLAARNDFPSWMRPVIDLELSDAQGVDGTADGSRLGAGEYAVVCVDRVTGLARAASPLVVGGS